MRWYGVAAFGVGDVEHDPSGEAEEDDAFLPVGASIHSTANGSRKAWAAVSKLMPWRWKLVAALTPSHSKPVIVCGFPVVLSIESAALGPEG